MSTKVSNRPVGRNLDNCAGGKLGLLWLMLPSVLLILVALVVLGWSEIAIAVAVLLPLMAITLMVQCNYMRDTQRCVQQYGEKRKTDR